MVLLSRYIRELATTRSTLDSLIDERDQHPGEVDAERDERIAAIQAGRVALDRALKKARKEKEAAAAGDP